MEIVAMGKRRGSSGPLPLFSRCCPVPDQIYENPPAWVDRPPFCFSFFPECARSTVFFTNQYLLTYGFIFRFLIPLAEDFDTWTQEVSFTRIFCMRCIQDDPSVESYFSGLPCFCDLYEWSRLVPLTAVHESAVLAAQHPRLKTLVAWWLLDSRGVEDAQTCRGITESTLLIRFVERVTSFLFFLPLRLRLRAYFDIWSQLPATSSTALPSLYVPVQPPVEQLDLQSLLDRVTEKFSGLSMDPRGCPAALDTTRGFFPAALARARECDLPSTEITSLVHRGSMEHQAAQQLVSSLSGTSGGKSRKKAAKKKLASCSDSLTQLLVLALDFKLPKTKEEAPLSAPAASPACSPFLSLSPSSSVGSPSLPPVLQVNPLLRAAGDGGLVSPVGSPSRRVVKRSPRALPYSASPRPSLKASCSPSLDLCG